MSHGPARGTQRLLVLALLAGGCLPALAQRAVDVERSGRADAQPTRWAVVVGVNLYVDRSIDSLNYAVADAELLVETLVERCGYQRGNILVLTDKSKEALKPMRLTLQAEIPKRLMLAEPGDTVLVFFSGHGFADDDGQSYLAPRDCERANVPLTGIRVNEVANWLKRCKAQSKFLVLDCCHAGGKDGEAEGLSAEATARPLAEATGLLTLASCKIKEKSYEWPEKRQGVFSYFLVEGLQGAADYDGDRVVDSGEIYKYVWRKVPQQATEHARNQTPVEVKHPGTTGVFDLAWLERRATIPTPAPPAELGLSFTVRKGSTTGELLSDARVSLVYREESSGGEVTLARLTTDRSGRCGTSVKRYYADALGEFVASVSHGGTTKRWRLTGFPGSSRTWSLYIPESPKRAAEYTNSIGMKFRLIPAGEFDMGSPLDEEDRDDDDEGEKGPHPVSITRPFYLGIHEVTQGQWEKLMGTTPSHFAGTNNPVEGVCWYDAVEYCNKLSSKEGLRPCYRLSSIKREDDGTIDSAEVETLSSGTGYRLPTESQWEYACRAGTTTPFSFGSVLNGTEANCDGNYPYGTETEGPYLKRTAPVGSYRPNAWGLYDMHGNVWEWCEDWYDEDYYENSPTEDPTGPSTGASVRVYRGGGWNSGRARSCRAAYRVGYSPDYRYYNLGFRLALVPSE